MLKPSTCIIAYNGADKIADATFSVIWADEIIVANSVSTNGPARVAQDLGARSYGCRAEGSGYTMRNPVVLSGSVALNDQLG